MKAEDKALIQKFWKWHKTRVSRSNSTFDLDYYELVEDLLKIAEIHANQNVIWRKRFQDENTRLLLRNKELMDENIKLMEEQTVLLQTMMSINQENQRLTNEYVNSKAEKGTTKE